ncbi:MAG: tetratricopeptide (TPR) repeat protein [Oleiphilaceae bacterium]|jgi:tetratricopeptide (TPR) repeat protein
MYYTKIVSKIVLLLLLVSCSNTALNTQSESKVGAAASSFEEEITIYKNAILALNNDELDKAEKLFTKMSVLQPDIAGSWANLALIKIKNGQLEKAETFIEIALQKNPKMPQALNLSGYLAQKQGKIKQAEALYQQAVTIKPDYALAHYNLALIYDIYLQDILKAIDHYQLYLINIKGKDEKTSNWLEGLKTTVAVHNS